MHTSHTARPVVVSGRAGWFDPAGSVRMLAERRNFRTHGSLSGRWVRSVPADTGQMTTADRDALSAAIRDNGAAYLALSYTTPVAWFAGDAWTMPDRRYVSDHYRADGEQKTSVTTSKHCHAVRMAVGITGGEIDVPNTWV